MIVFYADYIANLRALFSELDRHPEQFQTFNVRLELVAGGGLFVYETKRRKGQTDSLYYARSATGANQQISQASAFSAIDRFFALGEFAALTAEAAGGQGADVIDTLFPHCAVNFSYRKKGQPVARSMLMVFVGFNDTADAERYVETSGSSAFVSERPHYTERSYEWK
ncbi:hypothetical protein [Sinorhizobium sp. BG8]|uniref:hypothetical protein n=1 Tax=Sinorhizobium sp. BG8 TaxID=2613773 RepID=UPI00193E4E83|nr:hypothetical protein [Sinorhizobium sp. BG8]QRM57045.1 hypothetical protein F3Y30_21125 [Sinorhizobium sp. BG8]